MINPSAWRPLSEAPKDKPIVVDASDLTIAYPDGDAWIIYCEPDGERVVTLDPALYQYVPIADTLELDRAAQHAIAFALGQFLHDMVRAEWAPTEFYKQNDRSAAIWDFRDKIRAIFGNSIADTAPAAIDAHPGWLPLHSAPVDGTWVCGLLDLSHLGRPLEPFEAPAVIVRWKLEQKEWEDGREGYSWDIVAWRPIPDCCNRVTT